MNEKLPRAMNPVGEFCRWPRKPNRRERAAIRRAKRADELPTTTFVPLRIPTHGLIPNACDGWIADKPGDDAELRIERITTVRFDDGSVRRYYLMKVRPAIVQAKRELARKKLAQVRRENRDAEKREAKKHRNNIRLLFGR